MTDTEVFYGAWSVRVQDTNSTFAQRFVITGSDASDGGYPGVLGESVTVTGDEWTLSADWRDSGQFEPSRVERSATYDFWRGLIVRVWARGGAPAPAGEGAMLLFVQPQDPALDPLHPEVNPYDFTIPAELLVPQDPLG